ncbi:hypothetical protein BDF14DRAFT_734409 [Spinellus fusiger]|nr:hypothetical protein BDF14DRAFT_734409 [Spinellus fusiger]
MTMSTRSFHITKNIAILTSNCQKEKRETFIFLVLLYFLVNSPSHLKISSYELIMLCLSPLFSLEVCFFFVEKLLLFLNCSDQKNVIDYFKCRFPFLDPYFILVVS